MVVKKFVIYSELPFFPIKTILRFVLGARPSRCFFVFQASPMQTGFVDKRSARPFKLRTTTEVSMARILLVDDDPLLRKVLKTVLDLQGHNVVALDDGRTALQVLSPGEFDLVITDLVMPEIDGLEFILRIRKNFSAIPILALSGGGRTRNMEVLEQAGSFGANAVLPKPFRPEQFVQMVENLLRKPAP